MSAFDRWIAMQVLFGDTPKKSDIEQKIEAMFVQYAYNNEAMDQICTNSHIPELLTEARDIRIETQEELIKLQNMVFWNQICQITKAL